MNITNKNVLYMNIYDTPTNTDRYVQGRPPFQPNGGLVFPHWTSAGHRPSDVLGPAGPTGQSGGQALYAITFHLMFSLFSSGLAG